MADEKSPESDLAPLVSEGTTRPLTSADVLAALQQLLAHVKDFPWVGVGILSTCLGGVVMYAYYSNVQYTPSDITAVLGAGAAIAAVMLAYVAIAIWALAFPHWVFASSESFRGVEWRKPEGFLRHVNAFLIGAQLLGVGFMFAYGGWSMWADCVEGAAYLFGPGALLVAAGGALVGYAGWRKVDLTWSRIGIFVQLMLLSGLPVLFLYEWFMPSKGASWGNAAIWLLAWLTLVGFLGSLPEKMPVWALLLVVPTLLPVVLWVAPMLKGDAYAFPNRVMELSGIRGAQVVELRLPTAVCQLVASVAADGGVATGGACPSNRDWGVVRAQVLSNLGSRWWIDVKQVGPSEVPTTQPVRMTIPADSVQVVLRPTSIRKSTNRCKA